MASPTLSALTNNIQLQINADTTAVNTNLTTIATLTAQNIVLNQAISDSQTILAALQAITL